jgi:hypothetical protein
MAVHSIENRAISAAYQALKNHNYVSPIDVLLGMGILSSKNLEDWRFGKVPYLEKVVQSNLQKISAAMKAFRIWSEDQGLYPSETIYRKWGKDCKDNLCFSKSGDYKIEKAYRTHYVSSKLRQPKESNLKSELF